MGDGFADGEGATYDVTGSQTLVGSSENVFTYTLNEGTKASNYDIKTIFGTLTVTDDNGGGETPVDDDKVVTKTVEAAAEDGETEEKVYHLGDTVEWTIWIKNIYDEEKTLEVTEQVGMEIIDEVPEKLQPGEEITLTAQHVVTEADVTAGSITNKVTVRLGNLEKIGEETVKTEFLDDILWCTERKMYQQDKNHR